MVVTGACGTLVDNKTYKLLLAMTLKQNDFKTKYVNRKLKSGG